MGNLGRAMAGRVTRFARALLPALCVGLLPVPGPARAGGPAVEVQIGGRVSFPLAGPTDYQDVWFDVRAGVDAWVGLTVDYDGGHAILIDPSGRTVATIDAGVDYDGPEEAGVELHPNADGRYTVRVSVPAAPDPYPVEAGVKYEVDCRGGPATRCSIAPAGRSCRTCRTGSRCGR